MQKFEAFSCLKSRECHVRRSTQFSPSISYLLTTAETGGGILGRGSPATVGYERARCSDTGCHIFGPWLRGLTRWIHFRGGELLSISSQVFAWSNLRYL